MSTKKNLLALVAGGALVAATPLASAAAQPVDAAVPGSGDAAAAVQQDQAEARSASEQLRTIRNVQGTFAWNQQATASNAELSKMLYQASTHLCASSGSELAAQVRAADGQSRIAAISVGGDVEHAFTANVEEFEAKAPLKKVMGCTCSGNPADGRASANAAVSGFRLSAVIDEAAPLDGANTITFTSRDGFQVALPLGYVAQRYSIIVTEVNGEPASDAVGCSNQLWLGSTAARSFARDIVSIDITREQNPPAAPGAPDDANLPNVGALSGSAER